MRTTSLGDGLSVSAVGLGAMGMSAFYGSADEAESIATLNHPVDIGMTFIDTAEAYGPFANERLIGRALGTRRDEIVLATKSSSGINDDGTSHGRDGTPAYIKHACERSLRHLNTDVIDLYYLHRVDPNVPIEESVGAMAELVAEGKVLHIGLSEASAATIRRAQAVHPLAAVQTEFSLLSRDVLIEEKTVMDELGIGLVAYSPLGRGMLTTSLRSPAELAADDARRSLPRFQPDAFAANMGLVSRLQGIASKYDATVPQIALAWIAAHDAVPIPGSRRPSRVDENAAAADIHLSDADVQALTDAIPAADVVGNRSRTPVVPGEDR